MWEADCRALRRGDAALDDGGCVTRGSLTLPAQQGGLGKDSGGSSFSGLGLSQRAATFWACLLLLPMSPGSLTSAGNVARLFDVLQQLESTQRR